MNYTINYLATNKSREEYLALTVARTGSDQRRNVRFVTPKISAVSAVASLNRTDQVLKETERNGQMMCSLHAIC